MTPTGSRTLADIDRSLTRAANRRAFYQTVGDHRSLLIENSVIDRLLDERNTHTPTQKETTHGR